IEIVDSLTGLSYRFENVNSNHSISVAFDREAEPPVQPSWTITATASGGGTISPEGVTTIVDGGTQTFYFTPEAGKKVAKVAINGGAAVDFTGSSYTLFNVKKHSSIAVTFDDGNPPKPIEQFDVTTEVASGQGKISPASVTKVNKGGALLVTFAPEAGWEVDEVYLNDALVQKGGTSYRVTNVTQATKVSVSFKESRVPVPDPILLPVTVKVMPTTSGVLGGTVSPSGTVSIPMGESKTYYIYPNSGYTVDKVLVNGSAVAVSPVTPGSLLHRTDSPVSAAYSFKVDSVLQDTTAEVYFAETSETPDPITTHPVVASASSGGMISSSGQVEVPHGAEMEFSVKADAGYHLAYL
ncbi:MAG: hypothetical protein RR547_13705, partial [Raoultibacter sp.]